MPKYTVNYFIKKFTAIPDKLWRTGEYGKGIKHCALGHCGLRTGEDFQKIQEAKALTDLFFTYLNRTVVGINDSHFEPGYGPRGRILNALKMIRSKKRG